jgi:hypothetical protein
MNRKSKLIAGVILLVCGIALIGWNMRDPDRDFREPPEEERDITLDQTPPRVQAAIHRVTAGSRIEEIKEERRGSVTKYEVDTIRGDLKTEFEFNEDGSLSKQKSKKVKPKPAR